MSSFLLASWRAGSGSSLSLSPGLQSRASGLTDTPQTRYSDVTEVRDGVVDTGSDQIYTLKEVLFEEVR